MFKVFAICSLAVSLSGCTWFQNTSCDSVKIVSDKVVVGLAAGLGCSGVDAMQADVFTMLKDSGLCKSNPKIVGGMLSSSLCPVIVPLVTKLATSGLPATWKCSGDPLSTPLSTLCTMLPY